MLRFTHIPLRLHLIAHHPQSWLRKRRIQRYEHRACFQHSQDPSDDPNRVSSKECDHHPPAHSAFEQEASEAIRLRLQLVITDAQPGMFDRRLPAAHTRHAAKHLLYALVTHLGYLSCYKRRSESAIACSNNPT